MRLDDLTPRTWLIAGVAGWVVLVWILALAGMGGRVNVLAEDPGLLVPIPSGASVHSVLGPADQYQAIAERPLFASDRSPHPFFLETEDGAQPEEGFDYVLTSVLITPRTRLAIIRKQDGGDPLRVHLDEPLAQTGWRLVELTPRSAAFEGPQGRRNLELKVFDGTGGEPTSAALETGRAPQRDEAPSAASPPVAAPQSQPRSLPERRPDPARVANGPRTPEDQPESADPSSKAPEPAQEQMDAIRQRIEARRAALRKDEM